MRSFPLLALSLSALVGCKAIQAMDNTETMKTDLAAMKQTTGGMAGTTDNMSNKMGNLERKASVDAGLKAIGLPENTSQATPPAKGLLVGANLIAENMTAKELVDFFFAGIEELKESVPDGSKYDRHFIGNYSPEYVAQFNLKQQVRLVTLEAIAGQIPQEMMEKIISEHIYNGGKRIDTVYEMLQLRATFLDEYVLAKDVFKYKMDTIGKVREARKQISNLRFIVNFPNQERIGFKVPGTAFLPVVNPPQLIPGDADYDAKCMLQKPADAACSASLGDAPAYDLKVEAKMDAKHWRKLARRIDNDLGDDVKGSNATTGREVAEIREEAIRNGAEE